MKRPLAWLVAALTLGGCKTPQAPQDPFLRTTVPPPATGQVAPYYPGAAQPGPVAPPAYSAPPYGSPTTTPPNFNSAVPNFNSTTPTAPPALISPPPAGAPGNNISPRGGFNFQQSSMERSKVTVPQADEQRAGATGIARRTWAPSATVDTSLASAQVAGKPVVDAAADVLAGAQTAVTEQAGALTNSAKSAGSATLASAQNAVNDAQENVRQAAGQARDRFADAQDAAGATVQRAADDADNVSKNLIRIVDSTLNPAATPAAAEPAVQPAQFAASPYAARQSQPLRLANSEPVANNQAVQEITDLPQTGFRAVRKYYNSGRNATNSSVASAASASGIQLASATVPIQDAATPTEASPLASAGQPQFGFDPLYQSLRGRLEYSQSARQWKLRYIPIDGQTDQYGGSVVLPSSLLLEGYKSGDFVNVQGAVSPTASARGYSPSYNLRSIQAAK